VNVLSCRWAVTCGSAGTRGIYERRPRYMPLSSTSSAESSQPMFAMFRLFSTAHLSRRMHLERARGVVQQIHDQHRMIRQGERGKPAGRPDRSLPVRRENQDTAG
jgi:hypothetical protein